MGDGEAIVRRRLHELSRTNRLKVFRERQMNRKNESFPNSLFRQVEGFARQFWLSLLDISGMCKDLRQNWVVRPCVSTENGGRVH